jgi:hypothetical protein
MKRINLILGCLLFIAVFGGIVAAQDKKDAPCSQALLLQIKYFPADKPGPVAFPSAVTSPANADPKSQTSPESFGIKGVSLHTSCPNGVPTLRISLITARKIGSPEDFVTEHSVSSGDKFVVNELGRFGIIPWEVEVVPAISKSSFLPTVASESVSITATVESVSATLPTVKFVVKNTSNKPVKGFDLEMRTGDELRANIQPRGWRYLAILQPDQTYSVEFPIYFDRGADLSLEKLGELQTNEVIVVKAAVFDDGSFEGDQFAAWRVKARDFGDRIQVGNAISTLDKLSETNPTSFEKVLSAIDDLPRGIDPGQLNKIAVRSGLTDPGQIKKIRDLASSEFGVTRVYILRDLDQFKSLHGVVPPDDATAKWIIATLAEYRKWYDRLGT